MGLVAWYKLDGNAQDSSGNGNDGSPVGALSYTSGKVGQGASFNGSDSGIEIENFPHIWHGSLTLSMWVYWNDDSRSILFGNYSVTNAINFEKNTSARLRIYWNSGQLDINSSSGSVPIGEWVHVAFTRDLKSNSFNMFINGVNVYNHTGIGDLISSTSSLFRIGRDSRTGTTVTNGVIDDVKIFDHALSLKEVKELSKAKILHYTFDDFQEPTTNLIESIGNVVRCTKSGNGVLIDWTTNFGDTYFFFNLKSGTTLTTGDIYTLSFDCSGLPEGKVVKFAWSNVTTIVCTLQNGRNELTFAIPSVTSSFFDDIVRDATINNLYLYNFQLEAKNHATPFTPTIRTGLVKDISGYENNAVLDLNTTPEWTNDSRIGSGAYKFDGTTSGIEKTGDISDIKTISMWVKSQTVPTDSRVLLVHQPTGVGLGFYNNGYLILTSTGNRQRTAIISNFKNNDWNHIAVTYSDAKVPTCYINGVETTYSTTNDWYVPETTLFIGRRTSGSAFDGQIDDVRIYATALSADDVKELYESKMNIDSKGNLSVAKLSQPPMMNGLVAWYPLDGNAKDYSGNGNDGTVNGATVVAGLNQDCYSFDGSNGGINTNLTSTQLSELNNCSISFCAISNSPSNLRAI